MKGRLKRLLEFKKYEKMNFDELIEEYIALYSINVRNELDELLDELLILINRYEGAITKITLEEIAALSITASAVPRSIALIPLMYEKIFTEGTNLKMVFGATDERAIKALQDKLLWIGDSSNERISNKLHEIFADVYRGKYTHEELMDKLRNEFEEYKDLELHKLEAAADFTLRQGRNLGRVGRAIEMGDKYLQVVAKIDDRTTNICRSMHLRVIKVSDIKEQYDKLTTAQSINATKAASDLSLSQKGLWTKKLPENFGIPPYHFGCRTTVRQMSELQIENMQLDEFGREYQTSDAVLKKIREKSYHLQGRYKDVKTLIADTMNNIELEGVHYREPDKRVILGKNGFFLTLDKNGYIETCFRYNKDMVKYFYNNANGVYFDSIKEKMNFIERMKKWLGL